MKNKSSRSQRNKMSDKHRVITAVHPNVSPAPVPGSDDTQPRLRILASNSGVPSNWDYCLKHWSRRLSFKSFYGGADFMDNPKFDILPLPPMDAAKYGAQDVPENKERCS